MHHVILYTFYTYTHLYICKIPFVLVVSSTKSRNPCTEPKQYERIQILSPFLQTDEQFELTG